jgi:hypothetical protein
MAKEARLSRSTADEEPLVNGSINLLSRQVLVSRQSRQLALLDTVRRVLNSGVGAGSGQYHVANYNKVIFSGTYVDTPPEGVLPVIRRSQASAHSRTTSIA